jgi:hypothetical protein
MAERVFAETAGKGDDVDEALAAFANVYERLERVLSSVLGDAGYRAILVRSLRKAEAMHPCLEGITLVEAGTFLEPLRIRLRQEEPVTIREASVTLTTYFIELLWTLIGADLTLKLLRRAWPEDITSALNLSET